ncbi:MAG TPA: hypothetical protein VLJ57_09570 [Burkholderiaceae bacterium]|nr:hypothetical protein [Burkholderiaceae bacterium]
MELPSAVAVAVAVAVAEPGSRAVARLVEYTPGRQVAFPPHTTLELIENPVFVAVPGAAGHAWGLLAWQGQRLALLDLDALLSARPATDRAVAPRYALVLAFQPVPQGPVARGAIGLAALPQTVTAGDDAQCELPTDSDLWPLLALSCFQHDGHPVPILDTARLFTNSPSLRPALPAMAT